MSYKKPSYEGSKSLEAAGKIFERDAKIEAQRMKSNRDAFNSGISQVLTATTNALYPKQKALNEVNRSVLNSKQKLYDKVGSSDMATNYGAFDDIVMRNVGEKIERFGKINMALQGNLMKDPGIGQQELAMIRGEIDTLSKAIPNVRNIAALMEKAANAPIGSGERLSVAGAPAYQLDIIRKIMADDEESRNLKIYTENNQTMIYDPDIIRLDENNKEVLGGIINLNELNIQMQNKENPYLKYAVKTTPYTTDAFNNIVKTGKEGSLSQDFVNSVPQGVDEEGKEIINYEMTQDQQISFKNRVMGNLNPSRGSYANGGQFAAMLEDVTIFESIWEDQMGGKPMDSDAEGVEFDETGLNLQPGVGDDIDAAAYDKFYNNFYLPTLEYLAHVSLLNAGTDGIKLLGDENENVGDAKGKGPKAMSTKGLSEQEIFDRKWAKLNPKEKLKAPNGIVYTKS